MPVFYDCEASSLEGVPIEIGWAFAEVKTDAIMSEAHLIRPPTDWSIEKTWDPDAQALHGISLRHLRMHGRPVSEIAQRMNRVLDGRTLFADDPRDEAWLRLIFDAAGLDPSFTFRGMDSKVLIAKLAADLGMDATALARAKAAAALLAPRSHRAEADARHQAVLWTIVRGEAWRCDDKRQD